MGACTKAAVIIVLISLMVLLSGCMGEDAAKESKASTALAEERLLNPEYLPYSLLVSDPGRYSGEIIHITGKITEISADNTGYNILVSTDKQENGDYSGDVYSVLLSFASGSVSIGEIVDIKGEFIGTGGSSGSPEIKSQVFSSVYSPSEYMQMVSRTEAGRAELSKERSADNLSGNVSGNKSLNDEAFYSGNLTGNSSDNYSDDGPAGNISGKADIPDRSDISDMPDMNKAPGSPPEPDEFSEEFYSGISAAHYPSGIYSSPGYSPKYRAGMVIADRDENLLIVTACNTVTGKYGTRPLLKSTEGDAYLLKDSSFMELGSDYDRFSSIEERYTALYDDLSSKSRESGYNYIKRTGNRIYIRVKENHNLKGYLAPDSADTMKHVII